MKPWETVAIVGVGLIGGSIGLALRSRKLAGRVVGVGRSIETLKTAHRAGAIDEIAPTIEQAARLADLVVVCTPVEHIARQVHEAALAARPGTLITDAGSTKALLIAEIRELERSRAWPKGVRFVGSHPMAGNEKKGPQYAAADLFEGRVAIITPETSTARQDVTLVTEFWKSLGARTVEVSADEHDRIVAVTSHVPHLLASAIAASTPREYVTFTAGGWQSMTRIAAADPHLWRQILLANRENVLASVDRFQAMLAELRSALESGDPEQLEHLLIEAKQVRDVVGD